MAENRSRFVLLCQQTLAFAVVFAFAAAGMGVVDLRIEGPQADGPTAQTPGALVSAAPVEPSVRSVALDGVDPRGLRSLPGQVGTGMRRSDRGNVLSAPETVSGYATVGVTWAVGSGLDHDEILTSVRTKKDRVWSDWTEMHYEESHQADPGDGEGLRDGTDPVVVGSVDKIQVRVVTTGAKAPQDLELAIVDPGENVAVEEAEPAIDAAELSSAAVTTSGALSAPKPKIFSRAQWGADERMRNKKSLRYGTVSAGFVHHTVNANSYSKSQVPSILRGIYAFHTQSRGWSDIGYNFLVDRFGQIWEGRYGGVDKAVVGAHTLGYNDYAFAMSAIGNFDVVRPSAEMVTAYGTLMAWKLALHGVDASAAKQKVGRGTFPAINGHRDAGSTACPGRYLYEKLPQIRKSATALQKSGPAPTPEPTPAPTPAPVSPPAHPTTRLLGDLNGDRWPDLVVRDASTQRAVVVRTGGQTGFLKGQVAAKGWRGVDLVAAGGDLTGDGFADIVTRTRITGKTWTYPGDGRGGFRAPIAAKKKLKPFDQITGVGDFDGDGKADLVGRIESSGRLVLVPGKGDGTFGKPRVLAADWRGYDLTAGVDDFDGDGLRDIVARKGDTLYLFPGTGTGLGSRKVVPGRWGGYDVISGRGDATKDAFPDLLTRTRADGRVYIHPGDGAGGVSAPIGGWGIHRKMRWMALGGKLAGSPKGDLIVLKRGKAKIHAHNGRRNLGKTVPTGVSMAGADLIVNVGDWNGDGRGDVFTREDGAMYFWAGAKGNTFAPKVLADSGWATIRSVTPVGDVTGDGYPDLLIQGAKGVHRVVPSDGASGFAPRIRIGGDEQVLDQVGLGQWEGAGGPYAAARRTDGTLWLLGTDGTLTARLASGLDAYDWVRGLGDMDGDGRADLVVRERATGHLYLLPGRSGGFGARRLIGSGFAGYDLG